MIKLNKYQYSSSKRKTLAQCPLKFYHTYVAKSYPFVETPAVLIGRHCDTVLENAIASGIEPDLDELREKLEHIHPEYEHLDNLVAGVDAAHEYAVTRPGIKVLQKRVALDQRLQPTAVDWRAKSKLFDSAMFDLVTLDPDPSKVYVDDWKTGNDGFPDWDQIEDYSVYMFSVLPKVQVVEGSIVWLRKGRHNTNIVHKLTKQFRRGDLRKTVQRWADAHGQVMGYNKQSDWPAQPNKMCNWCEHYDFCTPAQEAAL